MGAGPIGGDDEEGRGKRWRQEEREGVTRREEDREEGEEAKNLSSDNEEEEEGMNGAMGGVGGPLPGRVQSRKGTRPQTGKVGIVKEEEEEEEETSTSSLIVLLASLLWKRPPVAPLSSHLSRKRRIHSPRD